MDELDLLKQDWKKGHHKFPKLSYDDIYTMILKKSSSIVKWIFIISLLEFAFWLGISYLFKNTSLSDKIEHIETDSIIIPLTIINHIILFYFFYKFYKNYKNISTTDNAKTLIENILKTRKTVKRYVEFNLLFLIVSTVAVLFLEFNTNQQIIDHVKQATTNGETFKFYATFIIATILILAVAIGILLFFYWLVYGILLKRLNKNYKELKKLDL